MIGLEWGKGSREMGKGKPGDGKREAGRWGERKTGEVEMEGKLQCGMGIFAVFWHKMHCFFSADAKIANYTNYN